MNSAPDVERNVSVVIKTFERPGLLARLVRSIRRFYPAIPVLVVDDSAEPLHPIPAEVTSYWHLPFNTGLAQGRNFGLQHVETDFVVFADDDLVFTAATDLAKMLRVLRTTGFDVVSCVYLDYPPGGTGPPIVKWFEGTFEIVDGVALHRRGATHGYRDGYPIYGVVHNFFMATRSALGEDPWDARLKSNGAEHFDFFVTLKSRGVLCTRLRGVSVEHRPEYPAGYVAFRSDDQYSELFRNKHGIVAECSTMKNFNRRQLLEHRYLRARSYATSLPRRARRRVSR
jgi:glycosyltransferase involved in cell wall biosynthesis